MVQALPVSVDLEYEAAKLGVAIDTDGTPPGGWPPMWRGCYCHEQRKIYLRDSILTRKQARSTLAHELGHAYYGDTQHTKFVENRAWNYAASLLISPAEYAATERLFGPHPAGLALALEVTRPVIEAWQRSHTIYQRREY